MKIIDCFTFYNELDLLNYRLNILKDVVDYVVLVEATHTHTGKEKRLIFEDNKHLFEDYNDKIIHVVVDDFQFIFPNIDYSQKQQWTNEKYQRNCIDKGLKKIDMNDDDLIIITDLDEIPDPDTLQKIKNGEIKVEINILEQDMYYYNLTSKLTKKWHDPKIICCQKYRSLSMSCDAIRLSEFPVIKKGGWHMSYFGDAKFIKTKIESFAHQEFNNDHLKDPENIKKHVNNCSDLYEQNDPTWAIQKVEIKDNDYLPVEYEKYLYRFTLL